MQQITQSSYRSVFNASRAFKINFNTKDLMSSFKRVPINRLILATMVLRACQISWFTNKFAPMYMRYAMKYPSVLTPLNAIAQMTFFKHFCGGSTKREITDVASRLSDMGIQAILDPAMEEDLEELVLFPRDRILPQLNTSVSSLFNRKVMDERRVKIFEAIDAAARNKSKEVGTSFVAVKQTCMVPTGILYMLTSVLDFVIPKLESGLDFKNEIDTPSFHSTLESITRKISKLREVYPMLSARNLAFLLKPSDLIRFYLDVFLPLHGHTETIPDAAKNTLLTSLSAGIDFSREVLEYGARNSIAIMVDAEQTYFQTAIHYLTFVLIKESSILRQRHHVFGTYQMYLCRGFEHLQQDAKLFEMFSLPFALKVVRGAYMQSERERAKTLGLSSPINDTIEQTHDQYSKAIDFLLSSINTTPEKICAFFATHNIESIEKILSWAALQPNPHVLRNAIKIGQLLGMGDHLTLSIANSSLAIPYKYVPVGTLQEVLPYLLRRAQENSSLVGRAATEYQQIKTVVLEKSKNFVLNSFFKREITETPNIKNSQQ